MKLNIYSKNIVLITYDDDFINIYDDYYFH